jgi:hypothetical protein
MSSDTTVSPLRQRMIEDMAARSHASHGRAAVRQRSMALITFSWSRLT